MSLGDLSLDIMGTDPKYPKIVNQGWLDVDKEAYDNYPSDNNPLRKIPDLAKMWNTGLDQGPNIIPNSKVLPLGVRSAYDTKDLTASVREVVKEAKKAMMANLNGKALSSHLKSRFSTAHLKAAKDELQKISEEQGLLGNVYIDASAFSNYKEARQFLTQHRTRLARDMVVNGSEVKANVLSTLASEFRRNIVSSVDYNEKLFQQYKDHLVVAGRIPKDTIIDSKESLRAAFLYKEKPAQVVKKASTEKLDAETAITELQTRASGKEAKEVEAQEVLTLRKTQPIVSFAQEALSKGKDVAALKEMLRGKFAMCDIVDAAPYLALVASEKGLIAENLDKNVEEGKLSKLAADFLGKIGNLFPIVVPEYAAPKKVAKSVGVEGHMYVLSGKKSTDNLDTFRKASLEAIQKGIDPEKVKIKLATKMSSEEADTVISDVVSMMNSMPAGSVANPATKPEKKALFVEPKPKENMAHNAELIKKENEKFVDMFAGHNDLVIETDPLPEKHASIEIHDTFNMDGIDSALNSLGCNC